MYNYENASEQELIRRAGRGDVKAFARLYSDMYRELYKFALCMLRHPQDAEDAVSESVISAYENISGLRKEKSFRSWMFTILNNHCKKILHKISRESFHEGNIHSYPEKTEGCEPDYARQQDVRMAFEQLDEEERMIIAFSVFGGYRSEEIAELLNKKASSVRSRKKRAFDKMRSSLEYM